jgi:hypothetical protein
MNDSREPDPQQLLTALTTELQGARSQTMSASSARDSVYVFCVSGALVARSTASGPTTSSSRAIGRPLPVSEHDDGVGVFASVVGWIRYALRLLDRSAAEATPLFPTPS